MPRVIARVNHPKNEWLFNENWGVDLSVSTPHLITALVEEAVTVGRLVRILQFEGGQVRLVEVTLADDSPVDRPGDPRPRRAPRRHHRGGRPRRARRDAARRHGLRGGRRGARDGHARLRRRGPPASSPAADTSLMRARYERVVEQDSACAVSSRTTPSTATRRPGRHARDLAPPEEHADDHAATVADRDLERGRPPRHDAHRPHLTADAHRRRRSMWSIGARLRASQNSLSCSRSSSLDRLGQTFDHLLERHLAPPVDPRAGDRQIGKLDRSSLS